MEPSPQENSPLKFGLLIILVVVAVAGAGLMFDRLLLREGVLRYDVMAISNLLTGLVAGGLFWEAARRDRERRKFIRDRLRTIADMNHHIRNALQVISLYSYRDQDESAVSTLKQALNRIEWALNEVLPGELVRDQVPDLSRHPAQDTVAEQ